MLGASRASFLRYFAVNSSYAAFGPGNECYLDYCVDQASTSGQTQHFTYTYVWAPWSFQVTATSIDDANDTITIDEAGQITKTGIFL